MELKNALAVCLIALFSSTLVVLIARALDLQAAARLEPQLARIVEELQAIRNQGGLASVSPMGNPDATLSNGLIVYYLHGKTRCPTCRAIEAQAHDLIQNDFATEIDSAKLAWKVVNYEEPSGAGVAKTFAVQMPVIVLAMMKEGRIDQWKRLDRVWALVGDKPAYSSYVRDEIRQFLAGTLPPQDQSSPGADDSQTQIAPTKPADQVVTPTSELPIP